MYKLTLSIIFSLFFALNIFSQKIILEKLPYARKTISLEEANYVTSLYKQNGNHSAVTGGIGTEKLTDYANLFELKFASYTDKGLKKNIGLDLGLDYYTSASSDNINSRVSSASSSDVRFYPSINYSVENQPKYRTVGGNISFSKEWDYTSIGGGVNFSKKSQDDNREFSFKVNGFRDSYVKVVPEEFNPPQSGSGGHNRIKYTSSPRNSYDASMSYSQVFSSKFQMAFIFDFAYQQGLLNTPFHRVYLSDATLKIEALPDKRMKLPLGLRASYAITNKILFRSFFRFYQDDWGVKSYTANVELPVKVGKKLSVTSFYRYYDQVGAKYFGAYKTLPTDAAYFTSDYDLSTFKSGFYGLGARYTPFSAITSKFYLQAVELRIGHYDRSDGLNANIITLSLGVKGF